MATETRCPSGDCPTLGVEARPFERFDSVDAGEGEWLIYDREAEDAWIQSDLYYSRAACV